MAKKYLLFDIGGTHTRLALLRQGANLFEQPVVLRTPKKFAQAMKLIAEKSQEITNGKIDGAAGGVAGVLDQKTGKIFHSPNLTDWEGKNFLAGMKKALKTKHVVAANDTAVVGLGEAMAGSGRKFNIVSYITVSTGVNGARIVNKKIDPTVYGFEIGKQLIGNPVKTLESLIAGSYIKKRTGKNPHEIKDQKFWAKITKYLAIGLNNTILHWSPEVLILGGGVMNEMSVSEISKELRKLMFVYPKLPVIKRSSLKDFGGLYGAKQLVKNIRDKTA